MPAKKSKKRGEKNKTFQLVLNIFVFVTLILVFVFIELNQLKQQNIISSIITIIILSAIILLLGLFTIIPQYVTYVGWTLIVFSIIMTASGFYLFTRTELTAFSVAKILTAIVLFLYGIKLRSKKEEFVSIEVFINPKKVNRKF